MWYIFSSLQTFMDNGSKKVVSWIYATETVYVYWPKVLKYKNGMEHIFVTNDLHAIYIYYSCDWHGNAMGLKVVKTENKYDGRKK